jgi:hypothetical protein
MLTQCQTDVLLGLLFCDLHGVVTGTRYQKPEMWQEIFLTMKNLCLADPEGVAGL